jgi:hypothetical protein
MSTVDHSDIRGSGRTPAVMVVIRRELPRTSHAGLAGGRSHRTDEGSPFQVPPRPRSHPCHARVGDLRGVLALDLDTDGPDEAEELASDGGHDVRSGFATGGEAPVAVMKPVLEPSTRSL